MSAERALRLGGLVAELLGVLVLQFGLRAILAEVRAGQRLVSGPIGAYVQRGATTVARLLRFPRNVTVSPTTVKTTTTVGRSLDLRWNVQSKDGEAALSGAQDQVFVGLALVTIGLVLSNLSDSWPTALAALLLLGDLWALTLLNRG